MSFWLHKPLSSTHHNLIWTRIRIFIAGRLSDRRSRLEYATWTSHSRTLFSRSRSHLEQYSTNFRAVVGLSKHTYTPQYIHWVLLNRSRSYSKIPLYGPIARRRMVVRAEDDETGTYDVTVVSSTNDSRHWDLT